MKTRQSSERQAREASKQSRATAPATVKAPAKERAVDANLPRGGLFSKGGPGGPGRTPGVPNKLTRDVREFLRELVNDPEVQESIRLQIMAGEKGTGAMAGYFTAVAHQVGKPRASVEVSVSPSLSKLLLLAREKRSGSGSGEEPAKP